MSNNHTKHSPPTLKCQVIKTLQILKILKILAMPTNHIQDSHHSNIETINNLQEEINVLLISLGTKTNLLTMEGY